MPVTRRLIVSTDRQGNALFTRQGTKFGRCSCCGSAASLVQSTRTGRWYMCAASVNPHGAHAFPYKPHECDPEGIAVMEKGTASRESDGMVEA